MYKTLRVCLGGVVLLLALAMSAQAGINGDFDADGDVDLQDWAIFRNCMLGPGQSVSLECQPGRFDGDPDIDLRDAAGFQSAFTACPGSLPHDNCRCPIPAGDGTRSYSNVGATTDGPNEPTLCNFFGQTQVSSDLWYCYKATCTGTAFISLCGSAYDTKLAVYGGCGCPSASPLACSDDDCGRGVENVQSRVEVSVTAGQRYMVRVGGFASFQGPGLLTIGCNVDSCATGVGDCFTPTSTPGCGNPTCCSETCDLDQYCCDVEWDATCAAEAGGVCTGGFPACGSHSGACSAPQAVPGCADVACCNEVCSFDPYCCLTQWDSNCVSEAAATCGFNCGSGGDCFVPHPSPGCDDVTCCEAVCAVDDFCCVTQWDALCVGLAVDHCSP